MADLNFEDIARRLSDLEVAILVCLVAREHCLVETTNSSIDDLAKELALICSSTFGLSFSILDCRSIVSIEDMYGELLTLDARRSQIRPSHSREKTGSSSNVSSYLSPRERSKSPIPGTHFSEINVVNVVIAKQFNFANDDVQIQMLQLMRAGELITETGNLIVPEDFLFLPLVAQDSDQPQPPLKSHLNDHLFLSHFHDPTVGYVYLEENDWLSDGQLSASSVIHTPKQPRPKAAKIDQTTISHLREASEAVTTNAEVVRYIQDIVVFLRLSRAVAGGISPKANKHVTKLARLLAPLHGVDFVTPSIVALAARKVFRHRIIVASPDDDRSLQYGSDLEAVSHVLADVTPDTILDGVLALEPPI